MSASPEVVAQALARLDEGWACFALKGDTRLPNTLNGFKDATRDPAMLTAQLSAKPAGGYGKCWPADSPDVVFAWDVDGEGWQEQILALERRFGPYRATQTTETPNDGLHLSYRWPKNVPLPRDKRGELPGHLFGFVVRWPWKGYVVGEGSKAPNKAGELREYVGNGKPIAEFPKTWAEGAVAEAQATSVAPTASHTNGAAITITAGRIPPEQVAAGSGRHNWLRDEARLRRGQGITGKQLFDLIWSYNLRFPEPKTEAEVITAIGEVETKFSEDVTEEVVETKPVVGGFPDESLVWGTDHYLAQWVVEELGTETSASPIGMLMGILAAWGGIFGTTTYMYEPQPSTLFAVLVGDTGSGRKGTGTRAMWRVLREALDSTKGLINVSLDTYRHDGISSGEGLVRVLSEAKPAHGFVVEEEFERLLGKMKSSPGYISTLDQTMRNVFDSAMVQNITVGRTIRVEPGYSLGVLGNCTASGLRSNIPPELAQSGFGNRFLWVPVRGEANAGRSFKRVWLSDPTVDALEAGRASWVGGRLYHEMEPEASKLVEDYYDHLSTLTGIQGSMTRRLHVIAARIGLIHASMTRTPKVSRAMVESGIAITEYCRSGMLWAFGAGTDDEYTTDVFEYIVAAGDVGRTQTEVRKFLKHDSKRFIRARDTLLDGGMVRTVMTPTAGRPVTHWVADLGAFSRFAWE